MLRKIVITVLSLAIGSGCGTKPQQTAYNLDFEYSSNGLTPAIWRMSNPNATGYDAGTDFDQKQHGESSLKIVQIDTASDWGFFCQDLPPQLVAGKEIELSGWIKTEDISKGFAGLYIYSKDENTPVSMLADPGSQGVRNSTDWTKVSIKKRIGNQVEYITFGGVLTGPGTAWFDNLELTINASALPDKLLPAPKTLLTDQEKVELRKYIYPLRTFQADSGDTADLKILDVLTGNSHVVALGENTHGSSETYQLKNRLIRYLAMNDSFDIFSIEANMPESYKLNEYTIEGKGDPKKLIAGMYFWTWNTQEMLDLVEWMKHFNQPKSGISFTGFDMQNYEGPVEELREAFKNDKVGDNLLSNVIAVFKFSKSSLVETAMPLLAQFDKRIDLSTGCEAQKAWWRQQVILLKQYVENDQQGDRDRYMAENLQWIKEQNPSSRIIVWAHNEHITQTDSAMGNWLKDSLGDDYLTFGFTFYDGSYLAVGDRGLNVYQAQPAYPGTLEYLLAQLNEPIFILDLKKIKKENSPILEWIDNLEFRSIGACKEKIEFAKYTITDKFDYLIFIWETTPSKLLKN